MRNGGTRDWGLQEGQGGGQATAGSDLLTVTTRFCRALRAREVAVTPAETIDAARALEMVDLRDRHEVYLALRSVLASRPEDFGVFNELFDEYWRASGQAGGRAGTPAAQPPAPVLPPSRLGQKPKAMPVSLDRWMRPSSDDAAAPIAVPRQSDRESLGEKDFSTFAADDLKEITRVAARIARRLASRPSRRWRPAARGTRIDMRRTVRQSLKTGGEDVELDYRERKPRKTKLVAVCDVSGSMDLYSRFLLQFLYALQNNFTRVETFVFSTRLSRVTPS